MRLLTTSPRLPAGLLSWRAWEAVRTGQLCTADADSALPRAVRGCGLAVAQVSLIDSGAAARDLLRRARGGAPVVWLAGPDGDADLVRALARAAVAVDPLGTQPAAGDPVEIEVIHGSWDPPGARLLDVVAVMDRLRSPGGCPWDAEQTHRSLRRYLLEEAYEAYDALVDEDLTALREELGDVLLQVAFHARLAEEADPPWTIDDVAGDLVAKLVRRHPHVFADRTVAGAGEVETNWEQIKRAEKGRTSVTEGLARSQPALALAQALVRRAGSAGLPPPGPGPTLGERLLEVVRDAHEAGLDAEAELRVAADRYAAALRAAELTD